MMKLRLIGWVLGTVAVAAAVAYGIHQWQKSRPTKSNLGKVAQAIWTESVRSPYGRMSGTPRNDVCLRMPQDIPPDSQSMSSKAMAWYMDYLDKSDGSLERKKHLDRLDALVAAGLLLRQSVMVDSSSGPQGAHRYYLSDAGWVSASSASRMNTCFDFAHTSYLDTTHIDRVTSLDPRAPDDEVYRVTARIGVASVADLQPWAQDPKLMALFPEIQKALDGKDHLVFVSRTDGEWVDYNDVIRSRRHPEQTAQQVAQVASQAEIDAALELMRKHPAPSREELIGLVLKHFGQVDSCLPLPGSSEFPVDQVMTSTPTIPYWVAISNNIDRKSYDLIGKRTQPYVTTLVNLGVMIKVPDGAPGTYLGTDFYELAPAFVESLYKRRGCLLLGPAHVEVVDLRTIEQTFRGIPRTSFVYKLRVTYPDHPKWANDPFLLSQWSELRGMVDRGKACEGTFEFDRERRTTAGGMGTCWLAFDSVTEVP